MTIMSDPETRRQNAMDQIKVMLAQEQSGAYRCVDYLGTSKRRRRRRRPSSLTTTTTTRRDDETLDDDSSTPSLSAQIAAVEECARFIGSLTVGEDCSFATAMSSRRGGGSFSTAEEEPPPPSLARGKDDDVVDASSMRKSPSSVASPLPEPPASSLAESQGHRAAPRRWPSFGFSFSRQGSAVGASAGEGVQQDREAAAASARPPLERWRRQMADWSLGAVDAFGFSRRTAVSALSLVDRYLSSLHQEKEDANDYSLISKDDFQLLCMTSLYTCIKIHEPNVKLSAEAVAEMSRGVFARDDVVDQESTLMSVLGWRMNGPLPGCFADRFVDLLLLLILDDSWTEEDADRLRHLCQCLCEGAAAVGELISCRRSSVGLACVLVALEDCGEEDPESVVDDLVDLMEEENAAIDEDELLLCLNLLRKV